MSSQVITSKNTSIRQVPAIAKRPELLEDLKNSMTSLNFGCGAYPELVDSYTNHDWFKYDPFHNHFELKDFYSFDVVLCANVLNVIDSDRTIIDIVCQIFKHLEIGGKAYFSTYEGNRSGIGKETTKGYQRNTKASEYLPILKAIFGASNVTKKGNEFICSKTFDSKPEYL